MDGLAVCAMDPSCSVYFRRDRIVAEPTEMPSSSWCANHLGQWPPLFPFFSKLQADQGFYGSGAVNGEPMLGTV